MSTQRYPCLVFDLDGTLTDPLEGIYRCMNHALNHFGYQSRTESEVGQHIGPPLEQTLAKLTGSEDEDHLKALMVVYRERYGEVGYRENQVYPGIHQMLEAMHSRNIPMGVCTSKLQRYALKILEEFDLAPYFDFVSGPDYGQSKSSQLADLLADGRIDGAALMIGDRAIDLDSARDNGLAGAGVLWGYGGRSELLEAAPAHLFATPEELAAELLR